MKLLLNLLLIIVTSNLCAQNTIHGTITSKDTNEVIIFATIYLPQLEKGGTTDELGKFKIQNLPSGNYTLIVSFLGYETASKTISIPLNEEINIALKTSAIEMEEIILSTPFHKLQRDNVMKVERANVEDLKAKGAVTLAEGITDIAGVESITTGLSIGKPVIRGLSSNRVLVYTQGVRLENQQFGDEHGLGINAAGIESIEVIKGPASLLYGSDALGGVLYLNPEKFATQNSSSGDVSANYYSNTKGYSTNAGFKQSGNEFKFIFRGSLAEHSDYDTKDYRVTNSRFREQDFKAAIGYQITNFKTEFRYNVNNLKTGIPEEIGIQSTNRTPLLPFQEVTNHIFSSKSKLFFNNSSLDINLGYLYNNRKEFEEFDAPTLHLKLQTTNYDIKYNLPKLGKFEIIVGSQGMHQINSNSGPEELIPDATTNDFGILTVSHVHFEKADLQLGVRYDTRTINIKNGINKSYNSFNSAIGAKTNLLEKLTVRLNLASGFRAPNLAELASNGVHEGTNRFEIGNPNLSNEQSFQIDLALEFKNEHIEIYANGFYNKVKDYIFLSPNGEVIEDNDVFIYLQEDANLYGGEFGLHFHPHPLDWLHFESSFETVTGQQDNDDYLPLIPANSISNTVRVEFETKAVKKAYAFIKYKSTFKQNNVSPFETNTNGYNLLSAGFGGTLKVFKNDLKVTISGTNLTDKKYINHLSRFKSESIFNIGRNISLGLTYSM